MKHLFQNMIERIEGLEFFSHLSLITLSHNRIKVIAGVHHLPALRALNIGYNLIERISPGGTLLGAAALCDPPPGPQTTSLLAFGT